MTTGVIAIKGAGVGLGTLPGLQGAGHGLQCKAEGQEKCTTTSALTSAGEPRHMRMRVAVCLHMQTNGLLTTYTHSTDQPIAHLRGQHPMTASEPPAKWGADSRVDDDMVCRVEEGGASAACRRTRERKNRTAKCKNVSCSNTNFKCCR